ncbi:MAG TPA: hypothetical protein VMS22_11620 [Candidatus Eisenbacteria bacterium]|nr:hypothetical protein [Candidatus Eisenbacteria bacterium]
MPDLHPDRAPADARAPYAEIFLVSLALILLEVSYTRIFSFKLVYYFTYVIIGIALLGIGSGGVLVAMREGSRRWPLARLLPACCLAGSAGVFAGYFAVALVQVNALDLVAAVSKGDWSVVLGESAALLGVCFALFVPFLAAGIAVAAILSDDASRANRLYFADLVGAGLGCAVCVPLLVVLSPPGAVLLGGAILAVAGLRLAGSTGRLALGALAVVLLAAALGADRLPDPVTDRVKTMSPQNGPRPMFTRWSPIFRVDVRNTFGVPGAPSSQRMIMHDGTWGSVLPEWNGDPATLTRYDTATRSYPFKVLGRAPRVAIIGAAGGNEILASLYFEAQHVTAVELNPVTVSLLTTYFRDYTGRMAEHPKVTLVNAEGRSFLMARPHQFDLVWFVAPDSYAAMNAATAGAYVLSESYLYTAEMIVDSLRALAEGGIICTQFGEGSFERKPNRTTRYVGTVRAALARLGVADPRRHVLVATTKGFGFLTSTILVKLTPFSDEEVKRFVDATAEIDGGRVRWAPGSPADSPSIEQVLTRPPDELREWYRTYPFDVRPVTDDAPFFWHFVPFREALRANPDPTSAVVLEDGLGERLLVLLLAVVVVFAAVFLLLPLLAQRRRWAAVPYKRFAVVYFAALGVGFMFLEVSLIQRLTLLLGFPTYSLTVTLFSLLVATGIGSLASERLQVVSTRVLARLFAVLTGLVVFYEAGLTPLVALAVPWPFAARVALAVVVLVPLGLCLGVFMPLGLRRVAAVSNDPQGYVAWAWAVNGFCSVVSSVAATVLSMTIGFGAVMFVALGVYALGLLAFARIPAAATN